MKELDKRYTAPAGGFNSREDYYETCSTHLHLSKISIPSVILTAANDPFVSVAASCAFVKKNRSLNTTTMRRNSLMISRKAMPLRY